MQSDGRWFTEEGALVRGQRLGKRKILASLRGVRGQGKRAASPASVLPGSLPTWIHPWRRKKKNVPRHKTS